MAIGSQERHHVRNENASTGEPVDILVRVIMSSRSRVSRPGRKSSAPNGLDALSVSLRLLKSPVVVIFHHLLERLLHCGGRGVCRGLLCT